MDTSRPETVDDYINSRPKNVQKLLTELRQIIKSAAPLAQEKISYGMPYYSLNGRLAYFAAHHEHIGFYPMASTIKRFKNDLSEYKTSKGTVQFPLSKPLPTALISKMVEFKAKENLAKSSSK